MSAEIKVSRMFVPDDAFWVTNLSLKADGHWVSVDLHHVGHKPGRADFMAGYVTVWDAPIFSTITRLRMFYDKHGLCRRIVERALSGLDFGRRVTG